MIGKKMIHPKYIDEVELVSFGIKEEVPKKNEEGILKERLSLSLADSNISYWITKAAKIMLSGKNVKKKPQLAAIP